MSKKLDNVDEFLKRLKDGTYSSAGNAKQAISRAEIKWDKKAKDLMTKAIEKHSFGPQKKKLPKVRLKKKPPKTAKFSFQDLNAILISFLELDGKGRRAVLNLLSYMDATGAPIGELHSMLNMANDKLRAK